MISKPIVPPWDDSAKNIVRTQTRHGSKYVYRVPTIPGAAPTAPGVISEPIYDNSGRYSPRFANNARLFVRGLHPRGVAIYHYFFAPNPVTSVAGRLQQLVSRVKTVQTVCSIPATFKHIRRFLFTDRTIVLSRDTQRKMIDAGVDPTRLRMIRPGIEPLPHQSPAQRAATREGLGVGYGPLVLFPGDYEFSTAAETVAAATPMIAAQCSNAAVVFACRIKQPASRAIRARLERDAIAAGLGNRVHFLGSVPNMPTLVGAADVVVLPAERLYAKMDAPLVLLEAMSQEVPLVLADSPPLDEIVAHGAGLTVPPGNASALAEAVVRILGDPDLARRLGKAGKRAVDGVFSAATMARQVEEVYDELLDVG